MEATPMTPMFTTVYIKHGKAEEKLQVEPFGLLESEVKELLKFNAEMTTHCRITGLKDVDTLDVIKFRADELNTACIDASKLKEGHKYEIVLLDARENDVAKLTPDQVQIIEEEFKKLDLDNNGYISKKEIKTYYENHLSQERDMMRKEVDKKIKKEPHRHVEYENLFVKLCQIKLQQAYAAINVLVEMDTNRDGFIDKDEFFQHEARRLTALKIKSPTSPDEKL